MKLDVTFFALIQKLSDLEQPTRPDIEDALAAELLRRRETEHRATYGTADAPMPFTDIELLRTEKRTVLSFEVASGQDIARESLELARYGEPSDVDINLDIEPNTVTYEYAVGKATLGFEFSRAPRLLRFVHVTWAR